MCTINEDQFLKYNAADIIFFSFWTIFCAFTPLATPKIKILKKLTKTPGDIIIWHKCTKNQDHMLHCSWDRCMTDIISVFHFGIYFALTSLKNLKIKIIIKLKKKKKKTKQTGDIIILHMCTKNNDQNVVHDTWTDRRTDTWTEKVTYRGGCPT